MTLVTRRPSRRSRPFRKSSSTRKARPDHVALEPLDELDRPLDRPARREEVVDDQDLLPGLDRVAVDLERVRPVFEGVLHGDRLGRQLAQLADGDEARLQLVRHRRAEDEAPRLHPDDDVDLLALIRLEHQVDRLLVGGLVLQKGRDVVEEDAGLREVGDLADLGAKLLGGHRRRVLQAGRQAPSCGPVRISEVYRGSTDPEWRRSAGLPRSRPIADRAGRAAGSAPSRRSRGRRDAANVSARPTQTGPPVPQRGRDERAAETRPERRSEDIRELQRRGRARPAPRAVTSAGRRATGRNTTGPSRARRCPT